MAFYSLFLALSSIFLFLSSVNKKTHVFFYFAVFLSVIFSGLRYDAGNDFPTYYEMTKGYIDYSRLEVIPKLLMDISVANDSPLIFFFMSSMIYISCVSIFCIKMSKNKEMSFFLFLVLPLSFLTSLGYVRQFMSIGFFMAAIAFYANGSRKISILMCVCSVLCHSSSIFAIPLVFLYRFLSSRKIPFLVSICFILFSILSANIIYEYAYLAGRYQHYITGSNVVDSGKKIGYLCIGVMVYFYLFRKKIVTKNEIYAFNLFVIFCVIYSGLMDFGEYVSRVAYFLFPAAWVVFPSTISFKGGSRLMQAFMVLLFGVAMFYTTLYLAHSNPTRDFLTNYELILFK